MIIKIDDTYSIEKDDYNYTLKESKHKRDKKGKDIFVTHGFFTTLDRALNRLVHIKADMKADKVFLGEYIELIQNERYELEKLVKGVDMP